MLHAFQGYMVWFSPQGSNQFLIRMVLDMFKVYGCMRNFVPVNRITYNPERSGPLFTDFDRDWVLRDTPTFIAECLPSKPNPLSTVMGFHVGMLILGVQQLVLCFFNGFSM